MAPSQFIAGRGLDIGTSFLISSRQYTKGEKVMYTEFRDAFLRLKPSSPIAKKMMAKGLKGQQYFEDTDGSYIVVGQDAIERAIERNISANRPLVRGIISPREKQARRILRHIFKEILGKPQTENEKVVYSVPAQPIDQNSDDFDVGFHTDALNNDIRALGFEPSPLSEAEAICYSELEQDDYSGICCLLPKTQIYTKRGLVNIEDVLLGDEVVTHKGRWKKVTAIIPTKFEGMSTKIQIHGSHQKYGFVKDHKVYTQTENGEWQWVGSESLSPGDILGEPILYQNKTLGSPVMTICERITSSKEYSKKNVEVFSDVQRLIGYFLGDGSVGIAEGCIQFDFHKQETNNIQDVRQILKKNFNKESSEIVKSENCIRIKCYSKGLCNYFSNHFYDDQKNKKYPWDLNRLNNSQCISLLAGLIRSDGTVKENTITFYNTNSNLAILTKQLFHRLGIPAVLNNREPRTHYSSNLNRPIEGKKIEWQVSTGSDLGLDGLIGILNNINIENSKFIDRTFIAQGFACSRITNIEQTHYKGLVYDISVEDDHSFCAPYMTMHNCSFGAGMVNACLMSSGEGILHWSTTKSGDWVDRMAALATAQPDTVVQVEKEGSKFLIGKEVASNPILSAVSMYYVRLIRYTIEHLVVQIAKADTLPKFTTPIPIIVAGGTSLAEGFVAKFEELFKPHIDNGELPFEVKEVRMASSPLRAVSRGCLLASQL